MSEMTGEGYIFHFMVGFTIMGLFFIAYRARVMWPVEAIIIGSLSVLLGACLWELYGELATGKKFDSMDLVFSILGVVVPALGILVFSLAESSIRYPELRNRLSNNGKDFMAEILSESGGDIYVCADELGFTRQYVYVLMNRYGLTAESTGN